MNVFSGRISRIAVPFVIATVSIKLACFAFVSTPKASAVPSTMNFQGRLADTSGNIMPDGLYNMQFRLFTVSTGGTASWTETRETTNRVQVTNGLFSTQLGAVTPITASLFSGNDVYFEITMPTPGTATCNTASCASWESAMTPRNKMATSAYAFQSENANTLDGLDSTAFAAATGSANYIQNTTSPQTANFNITGAGTIGGALLVQGGISAPGGGSQSQAFGLGATATGSAGIALGYGAVSEGSNSIVIGHNASAAGSGGNVIVIGKNASAGGYTDGLTIGLSSSISGSSATSVGQSSGAGWRSTSLGFNAQSTNQGVAIGYGASSGAGISVALGNNSTAAGDSTAIGPNTTTSGGQSVAVGNGATAVGQSIALGSGATSTASNQFVVGGTTSITQGYFGNGVTATSPQGFTLNASGGSGSDVAGANFTLAGGRSTGLGTGGSILFQTTSPQSGGSGNGSYMNTLSTRMVIQGNGNIAMDTDTLFVDSVNNRVGVGTAAPEYLLDVRKTVNGPLYSRIYNDRNGGNDIAGFIIGTFGNATQFQLRVHNPGGGESATLGGSESVNFNNTANGNMTFLTNNTERLRIHNTGTVSIGTTSSVGQLAVFSTSSTRVGQVIQGAVGQSVDLLQAQNSAGTTLASISASGQIFQGANQVCDTSNNCNYAVASGSANYIQNGTSPQTSDFNITGTGTAAMLQAATFDRASTGTLTLGGTNATSITLADDTNVTGNITASGSATFASIKQQYTKALTVDAGGKGDYTTISAAYSAAVALTPSTTNRIAILVYPGTYNESLTVNTSFISVYGSGRDVTRLEYATTPLTVNTAVTGVTIDGMTIYQTVNDNNSDIVQLSNGSITFTNNRVLSSGNQDTYINATGATGGHYSDNIFEGASSSYAGGLIASNGLWQNNAVMASADGLSAVSGGTWISNYIWSVRSIIYGGYFYDNTFTNLVEISGGTFKDNTFSGEYNNAPIVDITGGAPQFTGGSVHNTYTGASGPGYGVYVSSNTATPVFNNSLIIHRSGNNNAIGGVAGSTITLSNVSLEGNIDNNILIKGTYTRQGAQTASMSSGTAAFMTTTNSATAFQIQNASSASLFTADTINNNIVLGAATSLTLTGGNTASRPASPTEGMVYFDSETKQLLTYTNGKWQADRSDAVLVAASNSSNADKAVADYIADGNTGAAADGDQVQINSALTAGSGKKVVLLAGTYVADATILVPNNTMLAGVGKGTLIEMADIDVDDNLIENSDISTGTGVTLRDMKLDGRKDLNTSGAQKGLSLNGMGDGSGSGARNGASIIGLWIHNFNEVGVNLNNSDNNLIDGLTIRASGVVGVNLVGSSYNRISESTSQSDGYGFRIADGSDKNILSGNIANDNGYGITITSSNENTLASNKVGGSIYQGIHIVGSSRNSLNANYVSGTLSHGITLDTSTQNVLDGNTVHDSYGASYNYGIRLVASDANRITNNTITDTGCSTNCYAIDISDVASDNTYLSGNTFSTTSGTATINDAGTDTVYANQSKTAGGLDTVFKQVSSTSAFQIQNAASGSVLNVDTVNSRVGINNVDPQAALDVAGDVRVRSGGSYGLLTPGVGLTMHNSPINRTLSLHMTSTKASLSIGDTSSFAINLAGSEQFTVDWGGGVGINNTAPTNRLSVNTMSTADAAAQVAVGTGAATNKGLVIQGFASQSAELIQLKNSAGTGLATFNSVGELTVTSATANRTSYGAGWTELQNNGGNITTRLMQTSNDQMVIGVGSTGNYLGVRILAPNNSSNALNLRTVSGHTGLLFGLQNSSGGTMSGFNANGDLSIGGSNAANSTTALLVQNASNASLLTVDSTNNRIVLGTSDTTGVLLVLDTKTNAGDPTGVDGAMYYNSNMARFRCYESGAWKNCTGANPTNGSTATQGVTAGTDTYLTASDLLLPTGGLQGPTSGATNGTKITWKVVMSKTAAGTAASTFTLRMGTNGTTADTSRCTFSTGTATAVADGATVYITAYAIAGGASSTLNCSMSLTHQLPSTGFSDTPVVQTYSTAASADSTTSGTKMGLSFNAGTSSVITIQSVEVTSTNL